jgi:hypothetical protein
VSSADFRPCRSGLGCGRRGRARGWWCGLRVRLAATRRRRATGRSGSPEVWRPGGLFARGGGRRPKGAPKIAAFQAPGVRRTTFTALPKTFYISESLIGKVFGIAVIVVTCLRLGCTAPGKEATGGRGLGTPSTWPSTPGIVANMAAPLLPPELKTFVAQRYLAAGRTPSELVVELKADFGVAITSAQLRQFLSRSGLSARKAEVDKKTCSLVSAAAASRIAKTRAADPVAQLEKWGDRAVAAADAAFAAAEQSGRPRDLASAISAAATAVRMYQACRGLDAAPRGPSTFNYSFASLVIPRADAAPEAVEVVAEAVQ